MMCDMGEISRDLPFPYDGDAFPDALGVVVMRTVLEGVEPARIVTHWADGDWTIADGVHDAVPESATIAHMSHVVALNKAVAELATMSLGFEAQRAGADDDWVIRPHIEPAE